MTQSRAERRPSVWVGLVVGIGILVVPSAALYLLVVKTHPVYVGCVRIVTEHPRVQAALGAPVQVGWLPYGKVRRGRAQFVLSVSGPRGTGEADIAAMREQGGWHYQRLWLKLDNGARVALGPGELAQYAVTE